MNNDILAQGLKLINRYNSISKKPHRYGTDTVLYPSEIHVIDAVGSGECVTTTLLANQLGITKGGISQTTSKLSDKGLIEKQCSRVTNEVFIILTEKGKIAFETHKKIHGKMYSEIDSITKTLSPEARNDVFKLIEAINTELTRLEESEYDI